MATLNQIIYGYKNYRRGGIQSQSESISDRLVAFSINYYRAKLIKEYIEKGRSLPSLLHQSLGEVPLIKADLNENCEINECILRTETEIPTPLNSQLGELITYIGGIDGKSPYSKVSHSTSYLATYAKYTGKNPMWYQMGTFIYIKNPPSTILKFIAIHGIFEDPTKVNVFKSLNCSESPEIVCDEFDYDYEYPLPADMIDVIYKLMMDSELRLGLIVPQDTLDNGRDDVVVNK